jgi:hypothetical protein
MLIQAPNNVIIELDALLKFKYKADVEVTKLPVEKGGKISDNASSQPEELEIEGLVTDAEIAGSAQTAYQQFNDLREQLVTIVAGYDFYDNYSLTTFEFNEDHTTGEALFVKASFRRVTQVELQLTTVAVKRTTSKKSKGPQSTTAVNQAPQPPPQLRDAFYTRNPALIGQWRSSGG